MHRIAKNMAHLCIRLALSTVAGMLSVRIVLDGLGVEGYGTYAAVFGVVSTFATLNGMFENASRRFLSHEMALNGDNGLDRMFNVVLTTAGVFATAVILLGETAGLYFAKRVLDIPQSAAGSAEVVFHAGILTMAIRTMQIPFAALITSGERMSFFSRLGILEAFSAIAAAFTAYAGLKVFAVALIVPTLVIFAIHVAFCRRIFPCVHMCVSRDWRHFMELGAFLSWGTLGSVGNILKYQGTSIVINVCAGVAFSASWKIAIGAWSMLYALCTSFQQAFSPTVFKAWTDRTGGEFARLAGRTTLVSFLIAGMPAGILFVFTEKFLALWLGETSAPQLVEFVRCSLVNLVFDAISCPLTAAIDASGKVARYQIVTSSLSLLALFTSCVLLATGMPPWTAMGAVAACNGMACAYRFLHVRALVRGGGMLSSTSTGVSKPRTVA